MESDKWEVVSGEWERRGQDTPTAAMTAHRPPTCIAAHPESDALPPDCGAPGGHALLQRR